MKKTILIPHISIESLTERKMRDIILPPNEEFTLQIDYPIEDTYEVKFTTPKEGMGLGGIFGVIGKAYKNVYDHADDFGVWGHDIGDLVLEEVEVNFTKKTIKLGIGS